MVVQQIDAWVVDNLFKQNAFLAIFTAAFTPIPYKVFTIAGGLFQINLFSFVIASILGRGGR
jgi:membrane protein YqaA with SNARE-associated domain